MGASAAAAAVASGGGSDEGTLSRVDVIYQSKGGKGEAAAGGLRAGAGVARLTTHNWLIRRSETHRAQDAPIVAEGGGGVGRVTGEEL